MSYSESLGELTRWKPGQSGNPSGKKKRRGLTDILREALEADRLLGRPLAEIFGAAAGDCSTVADLLIESAIGHAVKKGDPRLFKEILDRIDGRAPEPAPGSAELGPRIPEDFTIDLTPDEATDGDDEPNE